MKRWWLSFVDDETDTFRGVCIVEAPEFLLAVMTAKMHGCNPGGQVQGADFPEDYDGPESRLPLNTLLSGEQLKAALGDDAVKSVREWEDETAGEP